jgi:hypothetical protein
MNGYVENKCLIYHYIFYVKVVDYHKEFYRSENLCLIILYILIHNDVRDFDKNSTQPEIRVNRIRDNESQLYLKINSRI